MINVGVAPSVGFIDARHTGSNNGVGGVLAGDYSDEAAIDAALTTANATYYTAAFLKTLALNDKIFALRNISDPTGFKPSGTTTGMI